jgi:diguanylate cyclase (GGDEF)-like protein
MVVDLDRFKQVNDSLGHHVGDLLLQYVGTAFTSRVRRSDTVARTGGDEFSVILEAPTSREDAERVADSLLKLLHDPIDLVAHRVNVGASLGIAIYPTDATDMEQICIAADLQMYCSKNATRKREEGEIIPQSPASAPLAGPAENLDVA